LGLTEESTQENYADARRSLGWSADETILLYLSRLHPKKGLDLLLHALSTIDVPPRARLVVVGGGDRQYLANLRNIADRLRDRLPQIDWIGEVWGPARWPYFEGADLFCLPTHSENFGLAVLEACSVGTASLTTTTTPWKEWLANGRGLIAEPTIESIAAKLDTYFQLSGDYARNRSALASWTRSEFSWEALAPRYAELYRSLISTEEQ